MVAAPRKLTPKERRFVEEYVVDFSAADAARRAGYKTVGKSNSRDGSDSALRQTASRVLRLPHIQAEIRKEMDALAERTQINAARIIQELTEVALRPGSSTTKVRALEVLAKIRGLLTDRIEHTGKDGRPIQVQHSTKQTWVVGDRKVAWN